MWSYSRLGLVNAQSIMHITFQLYDVLRFESTVVVYVLQQYIISKVKTTKYFKISKLRVHGRTSGLTSTPKAKLFCSCKRRKFLGQNKVKIRKF